MTLLDGAYGSVSVQECGLVSTVLAKDAKFLRFKDQTASVGGWIGCGYQVNDLWKVIPDPYPSVRALLPTK